MIVKLIGKLNSGLTIRFINGITYQINQSITLDKDKYYEFICEINNSDSIVRIVDYKLCDFKEMSIQEQQEWYDSLPTGKDLPESKLDWTNLD